MTLLNRYAIRNNHLHHHFYLQPVRTFVDARVKWVRDAYLDFAVEKEKNLKPILSLKNLIISQPSKAIPLSTASFYKTIFDLPITATNFFQKYPSVFEIFQPSKPFSHPHVKLTPQALTVHNEESKILNSSSYRKDVAERLTRLLMLTRAKKLPLDIINLMRFDLGLPHDFILTLLPEFPEYFQICNMDNNSTGSVVFGLELVSWRDNLATSVLQRKTMEESYGVKRQIPIKFPINLPKGFDLEKKVRIWVHEWQNLPYISPYEDAFFLSPNSDQAEKWTVAVLHELLHLFVSKKTEKENLLALGDYLGFGPRFKKGLVHHPGIFYVSNKIRTQTVVLREAYKKDLLAQRHLLMGMRYRYLHLMNQSINVKRKYGLLVSCGNQRMGSFIKGA
uniref:protein WHAT'S THIS FACTOR 9, mitochondrial-like n=1 Tax=Erigeron canadensis TaxID=72917 RepID=UPI001CB96E13|nr:protein WHAT'S THIS FACTOR 9, mitochondrial-like [Erigeron canadensis]